MAVSKKTEEVKVDHYRTETFDAVRPDGKAVTVTRNLDTGEQSIEIHE